MAKRMTKTEATGLGARIVIGAVIGLPIYFLMKLGEAVGWPLLIGGAVALLIAYASLHIAHTKAKEAERLRQISARRAALFQKYGDAQIVERIMSRAYWQGQSADQLRDSLGDPVDVDEKVMKTRSRQVWKYQQTGVNRFALRITLENGTVIGWDEKV
jgi:hypothetical protein